ncbi:DNA-binding domain-containing protein [Piscinibacter koreensis]|uniref:Putative DNA-binding domain-containing protein n=1 Tax=Piscinibacter koreensis TaxID=2742824 RepID=A0A7Y6NP95_9BURK|nr:DNA-binding domain-containing protein [Schlegelella koreensis]NUZ06789.1 putative DNA-binding domain-containing protein [Schlegelella koreensis]
MPEAGAHAARFAPPLLDASAPVPAGLGGEERYAIHRNNVTVSLIEALAAIYPAVERLTGSDFFRAMARAHVRATPPATPLLFDYGREFPAFIDRYPHARELPWLGDVGRVERAWLDAYHAADAEPLSLADLAAVDAARLPDAVLVPHPAARVVRSRYPALSIFAMNREPAAPDARLESDASEDVLITRPAFDVTVRPLPPAGATLLIALMNGRTFGEAVAAAAAESDAFDLSASLAAMVDAGVFTHIELREPTP